MDSKEKLVALVCAASEIFSSCQHKNHMNRRVVFLDWYLILGVDEESREEVIRMKYRQLALQIHPDKNNHQKADSAFKLVLEAYSCLSDKTKRRSFDSERRKSFCMECYTKFKSTQNSNTNPKPKIQMNTNTSQKPKRFINAFKEFQNRLKEECKVIENCLRNNKKNSLNGYPLFNPDNKVLYPNYPHFQAPLCDENSKDLRGFYASGFQSFSRRGVQSESPVYKT